MNSASGNIYDQINLIDRDTQSLHSGKENKLRFTRSSYNTISSIYRNWRLRRIQNKILRKQEVVSTIKSSLSSKKAATSGAYRTVLSQNLARIEAQISNLEDKFDKIEVKFGSKTSQSRPLKIKKSALEANKRNQKAWAEYRTWQKNQENETKADEVDVTKVNQQNINDIINNAFENSSKDNSNTVNEENINKVLDEVLNNDITNAEENNTITPEAVNDYIKNDISVEDKESGDTKNTDVIVLPDKHTDVIALPDNQSSDNKNINDNSSPYQKNGYSDQDLERLFKQDIDELARKNAANAAPVNETVGYSDTSVNFSLPDISSMENIDVQQNELDDSSMNEKVGEYIDYSDSKDDLKRLRQEILEASQAHEKLVIEAEEKSRQEAEAIRQKEEAEKAKTEKLKLAQKKLIEIQEENKKLVAEKAKLDTNIRSMNRKTEAAMNAALAIDAMIQPIPSLERNNLDIKKGK